jgi:ribosome modulation factor
MPQLGDSKESCTYLLANEDSPLHQLPRVERAVDRGAGYICHGTASTVCAWRTCSMRSCFVVDYESFTRHDGVLHPSIHPSML